MTNYINGGSPDYDGESFTEGIDLLTKLKDALVLEGWTIETDTIGVAPDPYDGTRGFLAKALSGTNNDPCWFKFYTETISGATKALRVRGDKDGLDSNLSPESITFTDAAAWENYIPVPSGFQDPTDSLKSYVGRFKFVNGADNRVWFTNDSDSFVLTTLSNANDRHSLWGGFYERYYPDTDATAWGIGLVNSVGLMFMSRNYADTKDWHRIYENKTYQSTYIMQFPTVGVSRANYMGYAHSFSMSGHCDRYTVPYTPKLSINIVSNATWNDISESPYNTAYMHQHGAVNRYNDKPILGIMYYKEPTRADHIWWDSVIEVNYGCVYRGYIKNVVIGMASLAAGIKVTDDASNVYLSGGDKGWQGHKIA